VCAINPQLLKLIADEKTVIGVSHDQHRQVLAQTQNRFLQQSVGAAQTEELLGVVLAGSGPEAGATAAAHQNREKSAGSHVQCP
jgi:hypothetical protein